MKKTFDFIGKFKYFLFASLAVMLIGLVVNIVFGTRMDVAFKGGTVIRYSYETAPDVAKVTSVAKEALGAEANVALDEINSTQVVSVTLPGKVTTEQKQTFADTLEKEFKDCKLVLFSSNTLSASMGSRFFLRCLFAVALAAVLLLVYVGLRFKRIGGFSAGLAALIALLHDLLIVYFAFVIFRIDLNENFVAVMLTILGYSLNDTIVIFDRIRSNRRKSDAPLEEIVNLSLNQCLRRTVVTSLTTCVAIACVLGVALVMRVDSIISFALPMLLGSISGCYSSICLSGPIWVRWLNRQKKTAA
ncbi:MAG: protein translocase subunit SecF [Clostridia bacterium]|nr:protein translocase subunit SecF [Loktanella sp.]MBQ1950669.1 protein translocase subunit SecF [Clostridia bacterium]